MAVPKTLGLETEYGIVHRGAPEPNPISASSLLINAYLIATHQAPEPGRAAVGWDFTDETPGNDARGGAPAGSLAPEIETHLVNAVLTNGARYYVDHAHPELSTPECADAHSVVVYDRAAELIAARSMEAVRRLLPPDEEIVVYKNNSDGKGNSYGCHENYLVSRAVPFSRIVTHATAHFVTRQIYCGAGKLGTETPGMRLDEAGYQISQRADFIEEEVGLETTLKRPIVNTRDEPHADAAKYRRLHVIVGDANMSQVATFLKVGTTALVMALTEDDAVPRELRFATPVAALRQVSRDLSLREPLELVDGSTITALGAQWELMAAARAYVETRGADAVGGEVAHQVLDRWEAVLGGLERDPMELAAQIDWVAKLRLLEGFRERHDLDFQDARLRALDIQYHDLRPAKSLAARAGLETLVHEDEAELAMTEPPPDTRAFFRGRCLQRFAAEVVAANWDSIVFDVGEGSLRRVSMTEPTRGTVAHVGAMFDECGSAIDLLRRLGAAGA
ncbi:MAG: proteasome accessory factor PafA2 [Acidimicrobiaceae bacterium]|nr:proteasome accessory factor PafA2 [Acidimicrobiaceae bacterium]